MSLLPSSPVRNWYFLLLRISLTAAVIYALVFVNARYLFHTELYESGDSAANSLSVLRAAHGQQLYGPYSRWMFHHPGPALFYTEAAGEAVFYRWLHLTPAPYNAQVLVVIGLLASFFAAGISIAARWMRGGVFLALALLLGALHFTAVDGRFLWVSTWSAYVIPLIFFCLLVSAASVGAGQGEDLPLLALAAGFLIHLHITQPLFVGPMCLLGYVGLWWSCSRRKAVPAAPVVVSLAKGEPASSPPAPAAVPSAYPWRVYRRSHRFALFIVGCFALPVLVDLLFPNGNFHQIRVHLKTPHGAGHALLASLAYLLRFAAYEPSLPGIEPGLLEATTPRSLQIFLTRNPWTLLSWAGALLSPLLPLAVRVWRGKAPVLLEDARPIATPPVAYASPAGRWRFLAWLWIVWGLSVGLTLYWGTIQASEMFYFNAWFDYSIWYVLALLAAGAMTDALDALLFRSERAMFWKASVAGICGLLAVLTLTKHATRFRADAGAKPEDLVAHTCVATRLATEPAGTARGKLLVFPHDSWETAAGVAVQLTRAGRSAYVTPDWEFMFGPNHRLTDWTALTTKPAETNPDFEIWHVVPKTRVSGEDARYPLTNDQTLVPGGLPVDPATAAAIVWEGEGANADDYLLNGWFGDNLTCERHAAIQFRARPVPATASVRLTVDFALYPFAKRRGPQRIELRHNGNDLGTLTFSPDAPGPQSLTIPAAVWNRYGPVLLTMTFPDAVAPVLIGEGDDRRPLAFVAHRVTFALEGATGPMPAEAKPGPPVPATTPVAPPPETAPPPTGPMVTPESTPEPTPGPDELPMTTPAPAQPLTPAEPTPANTPAPAETTTAPVAMPADPPEGSAPPVQPTGTPEP